MRYQEFHPAPDLASWVKRFWTMEASASAPAPAWETILPDGSVEIVLNFGDPFLRLHDDGSIERQPPAILVGQMSRSIRLRPSGRVRLFGARFLPGGAWGLLGFPQQEASGWIPPLDSVCGPRAGELLERVGAAANPVAAAEAFLRARPGRVSGIEPVVGWITAAGGLVSVDELSRRSGWSGRQLRRRFLDVVGLPPKSLARVVRLQRAARALSGHGRVSLAALAADCGYYDQSHFIRDFRDFAGCAPRQYLARNRPISDCFVGPEEPAVADFYNPPARPSDRLEA